MTGNSIHHTALIAEGATLGSRNVIGPFVSIGASVVLGDDNWIGAGAHLGAPPEVRGAELEPFGSRADHEPGLLVLGDRNVVRENVVIGRGWASSTVVADDCYIMAAAYLAHDVVIGSRCTLSSGVRLAGHVRVGPYATLGMGAVVHQRRIVGPVAMVGMGAVVSRDVTALTCAYGSPARMHGVNHRALPALGIAAEQAQRVAGLIDSLLEHKANGEASDAPAAGEQADGQQAAAEQAAGEHAAAQLAAVAPELATAIGAWLSLAA